MMDLVRTRVAGTAVAWTLAAAVAGGAEPTGPNPFDFPTVIDNGHARIEHVSGGSVVGGYGGAFSVLGPALQGGFPCQSQVAAVDDDGNVYIQDLNNNRILAIIDGRNFFLAGTGLRGFRDDCPAGQARFDIAPYTLHAACAIGSPAKGKGAVFVVDNDRVRRIAKKDGKWWVDTVAGGGNQKLAVGQKANGRKVAISGYWNSVCEDHSRPGTLLLQDWGDKNKVRGLLRISPDGVVEKVAAPAEFEGQGIQTDSQGRIYGWRRESNFTRFDPKTGSFETLAVDNPKNAKELLAAQKAKYRRVSPTQWDGPADKVDWYCPATWIVSRDGTELYASGGDDWTFHRVKDGFVKTMALDGKYHIRQAIPEKTLVGHGSPLAAEDGRGSLWKAGPVNGMSCIVRYTPGKDTEVTGE